jgi:hypothetical protein
MDTTVERLNSILASADLGDAIGTAIVSHLYIIGPALSLFCLAWAYKEAKRRRQMQGLPTSRVKGVFIGFVELHGILRCKNPVQSYLAELPCAYYRYSVQEEWRRTVVERDSKGNTRTRTESGWNEVASGSRMTCFDLEDETGQIQIWPDGAEIEPASAMSRTCGPHDPMYYDKGPAGAIANSTHTRRFTEDILPLDRLIFVVGQSRERADRVEPEIAHHRDAPRFLISVRQEEQIISSHGWTEFGALIFGAVLCVGLPAFQLYQTDFRPFRPDMLIAYGGLYLLVLGLQGAIGVYNSLIDIHQRVKQGFSLIDVQLKRRFDLLTNLVTTVKGFNDHESNVLEMVSTLRAEAQEQKQQHAVGRKILALAESYPELRSNRNFLQLQKVLQDTEDRIALARAYYLDICSNFDILLQKFPNSLIQSLVQFKSPPTLDFLAEERAVPNVKFEHDPLENE